jgi:protein-disulfide isomerase
MNIYTRESLRGTALPVCLGALFVLLLAPVSSAGQSDETSPAVAIVNGEKVHESELEAEASAQLEQVDLQRLQCEVKADQQRHEVLEASADRVVRMRLLTLEAERLDSSAEDLVAGMRGEVAEPTVEDIDTWWEASGDRVRQPRENVEDEIRDLLSRQRLLEIEQEFYAALEERYEVQLILEPFRLHVDASGYPSLGPDEAPVTIVEFSDFECPYCARVQPTLEQVRAEFPDTVRLVFRQFPLNMHANARKAAEASLCASDQGKFWEMHDLMFDEQKELTVAELKDKAGRLDLDQKTFDSCLDSGQHSRLVDQDLKAGQVVGVTGTPAMFVNGRMLSGAVDFETVSEIVNDEIARSSVSSPSAN